MLRTARFLKNCEKFKKKNLKKILKKKSIFFWKLKQVCLNTYACENLGGGSMPAGLGGDKECTHSTLAKTQI
jgi:hypothetical protein